MATSGRTAKNKTRKKNSSFKAKDRIFSRRGKLLISIAVGLFVVFVGLYLVMTYAASATGPIKGIGGKCLDNSRGILKKKNKIQLWQCNGGAAQSWTLPGDGTIRVGAGSKYCLDVMWGGKTAGTPVWLWSCNGSGAQQWKVNANGTISNPQSKLCLEAKGSKTANGTQIWMAKCGSGAAQKWTVPVAPTPGETAGIVPGTMLTDYAGSTSISSGTHVIEGKRFNSRLTVHGGTVTIRNSSFSFNDYYQILVYGGTVTVEHSEFDGKNSTDDTIGISTDGNTTVRYSTFKNHVNAMRFGNNSIAENNVISNPNTAFAGAHTDGIEVYGGTNITIRRNSINISGGEGETGCVNIATDFGNISNVLVEDNDFTGGTYSLYARVQGQGSSLTNVRVKNNRWHTPHVYGTHSVNPYSAIVEWSGNTLNGNPLNL